MFAVEIVSGHALNGIDNSALRSVGNSTLPTRLRLVGVHYFRTELRASLSIPYVEGGHDSVCVVVCEDSTQ